jgi:hypothetical protein
MSEGVDTTVTCGAAASWLAVVILSTAITPIHKTNMTAKNIPAKIVTPALLLIPPFMNADAAIVTINHNIINLGVNAGYNRYNKLPKKRDKTIATPPRAATCRFFDMSGDRKNPMIAVTTNTATNSKLILIFSF